MSGRKSAENATILDYGRVGHNNLINNRLPTIYLVEQNKSGETFLDMLARNIGLDFTSYLFTDDLIEAIGDVLIAPRESLESTVKFIDALSLSEQSYMDEHTDALIGSLQERQGLSPLHVWVWRPDSRLWEKIAPPVWEKITPPS